MKDSIQFGFDEHGLKKSEFMKHDIKFLFGDLNFWIDMEYHDAVKRSVAF